MGKSKQDRSHWLQASQAHKAGVPVKSATVNSWRRKDLFRKDELELRPMPPDWHLLPAEAWHYNPAALRRVWQSLHREPHSDKMKAVNRVGERITENDDELLRRGAAAEIVGITTTCLLKW